MATENQIAHVMRIMKAIQIIRAISPKRTCLEQAYEERVGINGQVPETRMNFGVPALVVCD